MDHHMYMKLDDGKVYCLPEGYEVVDRSLDVIRFVLNPTFTPTEVRSFNLLRFSSQMCAELFMTVWRYSIAWNWEMQYSWLPEYLFGGGFSIQALLWLSIHMCHGTLLYQTVDILHKASWGVYDFFWDETPHVTRNSAIRIEEILSL